MSSGISPIVATVIGGVTIWFWSASFTAKPPMPGTLYKSYIIAAVHKEATGVCNALSIKNTGQTPINNVVFEIRTYETGREVGRDWLSDPSLVSYWSLDGNTNDVMNVNNGTSYGAIYYPMEKYGGAYTFNGSSYILTSYNGSLEQNMTVSLWFKVYCGAMMQ